MSWLLDPYQLQFMRDAALVALAVGVAGPAVGVWVVMRRLVYLGDAMSHGTLGGVALALLLGLSIVAGALASGLVMALLIVLLQRRRQIATDSAIGIAATTLFATGLLVVSAGSFGVHVTHYLFGQIAAVTRADMLLTVTLGAVAVGLVTAGFRDLELTTLDRLHARQAGVRTGRIDVLLMLAVTVTVVVALSSVGLLLAVAMLIIPANTARLLATSMRQMSLLAVAFGVTAALGGLTLSYHLALATGPVIALCSVAMLAVTLVVTRIVRMVAVRRLRRAATAERAPALVPATRR